jgi:hypothetical protein
MRFIDSACPGPPLPAHCSRQTIVLQRRSLVIVQLGETIVLFYYDCQAEKSQVFIIKQSVCLLCLDRQEPRCQAAFNDVYNIAVASMGTGQKMGPPGVEFAGENGGLAANALPQSYPSLQD